MPLMYRWTEGCAIAVAFAAVYGLLRRPPGRDTDRAPRLPGGLRRGVRLGPGTCKSNCEQQGAA